MLSAKHPRRSNPPAAAMNAASFRGRAARPCGRRCRRPGRKGPPRPPPAGNVRGVSPPARNTGTGDASRILALTDQSCTRPVPPSSFTFSEGRPESSRIASTCGATRRAWSSDSSPPTCITCTTDNPGRAAAGRRTSPAVNSSQSCTVLHPVRRSCSTTPSASWRQVSRNVATGGGTRRRIAADLVLRNRSRPARHRRHQPERRRAGVDRQPRLLGVAMQQTFTRAGAQVIAG